MTHITCRLTAKNRDQLWNPTLGNRVWATFFIFSKLFYKFSIQSPHLSDAVSQKFPTIYFSTMTMHAPGIFQLNAMISALQIIVASIVSEETMLRNEKCCSPELTSRQDLASVAPTCISQPLNTHAISLT